MKIAVGWTDKYHAGVCLVDAAGRAGRTLGHVEIREGETNYSIVLSDVNSGYLVADSEKSEGLTAARIKGTLLSQVLEAGLAA